jgi:uncharacterized membrane protein (UPF0127 family)
VIKFRPMLIFVCALALVPLARAQQKPILDLATFTQSTVDIGSGAHRQHFDVWIATTPDQQEQGLMFVRDLPASRGMLFPEAEPRPVSFWMKNTYIELDLLFIGADHRIAKIAARATPLSLALISSDTPVIAVLEIRGGECERRGIHVGDAVAPPAAAPSTPAPH